MCSGVFSGTFSGTLNPALQDRFGRPKRDISTIIHILNDLLCATPQYRRQKQPQPQIKVQTHETSCKYNLITIFAVSGCLASVDVIL